MYEFRHTYVFILIMTIRCDIEFSFGIHSFLLLRITLEKVLRDYSIMSYIIEAPKNFLQKGPFCLQCTLQ